MPLHDATNVTSVFLIFTLFYFVLTIYLLCLFGQFFVSCCCSGS